MLLGIAIMIAFVPGVIGLASITSWAVMWLVMPVLLLKCKIEITIIHILGLVFLSYAALSLLWSPHGTLELMQLLVLASVFVWAYTLQNLRKIIIGLAIGLAVSSIIAVLQYFQLETLVLKNTPNPSGLFVNSNIFAEVSGMLLILILINKLWWFIPVTLPGLMVSSRAVILGFLIVGLLWIWEKSKLAAISLAVSLTFAASLINFSMSSIYQRLYIWLDMLSGLTLFGHGIGSFIYLFPDYNKHSDASINIAEYAHNELLQLTFELGIGVAPFILIILMLLKADNDYKYAFVFFIVISCFGFPLHMPVTAFMVAIVAAQLAKSSLGSRTFVYNSRPIVSNRLAAA
jgi:hypothetical protein